MVYVSCMEVQPSCLTVDGAVYGKWLAYTRYAYGRATKTYYVLALYTCGSTAPNRARSAVSMGVPTRYCYSYSCTAESCSLYPTADRSRRLVY